MASWVVVVLCVVSLQAWTTVAQQFPTLPPLPQNISASCFLGLEEWLLSPSGNFQKAQAASGAGLNQYGHFDDCQAITGAQYCLAEVQFNNSFTAGIGRCVPAGCTPDDVERLLDSFYAPLASYPVTISCGDHSWSWETGDVLVLTLFGILCALAVISTTVDFFSRMKHASLDLQRETNQPFLSDSSSDTTPRSSYQSPPWLMFSLYNGFAALAKPRSEATSRTAVLDGVRVLSIGWVMLGHSLVFPLMDPGFDNPQDIFPPNGIALTWSFQIIPGGFFAVDTFFWMGGFLTALSMLKRLRRDPKILTVKKIPFLYLMRYLRLTPVYFLVILFIRNIFGHLSSGPFWSEQSSANGCGDYWWTNILYVNNFLPRHHTTECMEWSWYLANDFQFFLFTPFFVLLYVKCTAPRFQSAVTSIKDNLPIISVLAVLLVSSTLCNVFIGNHYNLGMSALSGGHQFEYIYIKPYARAQPYLIGVGLSFVWDQITLSEKASGNRLKLSNVTISTMLVSALAIMGFVNFVTHSYYQEGYPNVWSQASNTAYLALSRMGWAIALSLFAIPCFLDQSPLFNGWLSLSFWKPLAQLTYGTYLVHPLVFNFTNESRFAPLHFSTKDFPYQYISTCTFAFIISFIVFIFLEHPLASLAGLVTGTGPLAKPKVAAAN